MPFFMVLCFARTLHLRMSLLQKMQPSLRNIESAILFKNALLLLPPLEENNFSLSWYLAPEPEIQYNYSNRSHWSIIGEFSFKRTQQRKERGRKCACGGCTRQSACKKWDSWASDITRWLQHAHNITPLQHTSHSKLTPINAINANSVSFQPIQVAKR